MVGEFGLRLLQQSMPTYVCHNNVHHPVFLCISDTFLMSLFL